MINMKAGKQIKTGRQSKTSAKGAKVRRAPGYGNSLILAPTTLGDKVTRPPNIGDPKIDIFVKNGAPKYKCLCERIFIH
uniref:Uncharacterized protein n=1 Tax=Romanomermis culicivorax TaxID=13658 RepID=A0A915JQE2_ROMCU